MAQRSIAARVAEVQERGRLDRVTSAAAKRLMAFATPGVLLLTHIVGVWNGSGGHWAAMVRPALVGMTLALAVTALCCFILRRIAPAVAIASVVVVVLAGVSYAGLVVVGVGLWAARSYWRWIRADVASAFPVTGAALLATLLLATTVGLAIAEGAVVPGDLDVVPRRSPGAPSGGPSIYVLILDGYPRADTLAGDFGIDNRPFTDTLEQLGFIYYADATSPATRTELTLLAMLGGEVDPLVEPSFDGNRTERRTARAALYAAPALDALADRGYWRVHVASPVAHTNLVGWDVVIDTGQITDLEARLLQGSPLAPLMADWVVDQQLDRLIASLAAVEAQAAADRQKVVLAHLLAPHPPFFADPSPCWAERTCGLSEIRPSRLGMTDGDYAAAFETQIETVNALVISTLRSMLTADPHAITIVMSDHGGRHNEADRAEWGRSLLAVRGTDALAGEHTVRDLFDRLLGP